VRTLEIERSSRGSRLLLCNITPLHHRDALANRTMRWPGAGDDDDRRKHALAAAVAPTKSSWSTTWTDPRTVVLAVGFTVTSVAALRLYKSYLRRIPSVNHIKPDYFRRRSIFGQVTSVGDADNFRLYHTPGGKIAGWGWLPWKTVPTKRERLTNQTVGVQNMAPGVKLLTRYVAPHTNSWRRCSGTRTLGSGSSTILERSL
jgi:hypothetical protein